MKVPKERQCFWQMHLYLTLFQHLSLFIIYFIWYTMRYMMRPTSVPPNITRSTKLWGAHCFPQLLGAWAFVYQKVKFFQPWPRILKNRHIFHQLAKFCWYYLWSEVYMLFFFLSFTLVWCEYSKLYDVFIVEIFLVNPAISTLNCSLSF